MATFIQIRGTISMVKTMKIFSMLCFIFLCSVKSYAVVPSDTDSFIAKKKKKKTVSKSKRQQQLGQMFDDQLSQFTKTNKQMASCLKKVAKVQEQVQNEIRRYLNSSKDGVFQLKKEQIDDVIKKTKNFTERIEVFCNQCDAFCKTCDSYVHCFDNSSKRSS